MEAAATWAARGAEAVSGQQRRCEVAGGDQATTVPPHTRGCVLAGTHGHEPLWATGKRTLPQIFFYSKISKSSQILYLKLVTFPMSKICQIL
jgi:hypothetical protein